jgi:endonuclease/exonuclease/phosphatase (EEP) superfamily protein YafD
MFIPSKLHHRSCQVKCNNKISDIFGLLCWNVHKNSSENIAFKAYLEKIEEKCDFLLLQEANFRDDTHFTLPHFSFDAAANLEFRGEFYGVLSASKVESNYAQSYLSEGRESLVGPHKSLLVSSYSFEDGTPLLILNVHAINFRENGRYNKELERFLELMQAHEGAMIVAGDFNTWNKIRMNKLDELREKLGLKKVPFHQNGSVKSFMGKPLDFIFYRGVELIEFSVDKEHNLSDHNPLFTQFKKEL